jgi:hypothetical protein
MTLGSLVSWLDAPVSNAPDHHIDVAVAWHGRLMVLAWAFIMPIAVVIARFFKIVPRQPWPQQLDNPFWFVTHRRLGYLLVATMTLGLAFIAWQRSFRLDPFGSPHATLGWVIVVAGWVQLVGSLARGTHGGPINPFTRQAKPPEEWPGDHFSMTRRRIVFEYSHKAIGYLLVVLVVAAIYTGLTAADAPRWMLVAIGVWWALCLIATAIMQRRIGCIDTYQAIWGLDRTLPGYRRKPIGLGITRFSETDAANAPWQKRRGRDERGISS